MKKIVLPFLIIIFILLAAKPFLTEKISGYLISRDKMPELETEEYVSKILSQTGQYDYTVKTAVFENKIILLPESLTMLPEKENVLGLKAYAVEAEEKRIQIDLTNQKLYAFEGDRLVYEFPVSSGLPWTPTVTGEFNIWSKLKYTRMAGGCEINDCYDLPNVPFTQYFYKGYALHGTYWHNDFGNPRSHGCVNLSTPDAESLYYWTTPYASQDRWGISSNKDNPGTKVIIYGQAQVK